MLRRFARARGRARTRASNLDRLGSRRVQTRPRVGGRTARVGHWDPRARRALEVTARRWLRTARLDRSAAAFPPLCQRTPASADKLRTGLKCACSLRLLGIGTTKAREDPAN